MSKMGCPQSDTDPNSVIVLTKKGPINKTLKSNAAVNAALRSGIAVESQKKMMAGGNRQHTSNKNTLMLDEETEELHHDRVPLCLGKAIQQARQAKEWTQKDLSTVSCLYRRLGALQTYHHISRNEYRRNTITQ
ncbi:unnamed protein product [Heligmosomoides polygyrus]|uniref:MBF1 domain-containing protein n=1 Tax=Heligmosomoides polygyrus TaxID=6339 RepID=A0A183F977_HELPZ|nr:unnamed protein product [Heligmosomoides polygyrus]